MLIKSIFSSMQYKGQKQWMITTLAREHKNAHSVRGHYLELGVSIKKIPKRYTPNTQCWLPSENRTGAGGKDPS